MATPVHDERGRIIDAAHRVLGATRGQSVSVTEVLREAGLSTRAFYRHFDSKDALVLAMVQEEYGAMRRRLDSVVADAASPPAAVRAWIAEFLRVASSARRRQRARVLSSDEVTRAKGYAEVRREHYRDQITALAEVLERGRRDGSFPLAHPEPDARSLSAAISQAFEDQMRGAAAVSAEEAAGQLSDFAFRALGVPRP
jgi:AcrR family transcriptional regulator